MPESVTTDNVTVATIVAATELTKLCAVPDKRPATVGGAFKEIFKAIYEARQGK
jgi:hypothetical protein